MRKFFKLHIPKKTVKTIFKKVSEISLPWPASGNCCPKQLFITFDTDWCHEEVLVDSLRLLQKYHAKSTFFLTNPVTTCLELLFQNPLVEVGIHPNFNPLFGSTDHLLFSAEETIDRLMDFVPTARAVRSHSLVSGSRLSELFLSKGLTHESNIKIPLASATSIVPFVHPTGMIMCPFQWADYSDMKTSFNLYSVQYLMLNFHPIHVFLNTESLDRYERTRHLHHNPNELIKHRSEGYGTRSRLIELLESSDNLCVQTCTT